LIAGEQAARGRYCWEVWPIFDDFKNPGRNGDRQPYISPFHTCYTSGPSKPVIRPDNLPGPIFSTKPLTGKVHFEYVPDFQYLVECEGKGCQVDPLCPPEPESHGFNDVYNCDVRYTILPEPDTHYVIKAFTWNSAAAPVPVLDASSALPPVTRALDTEGCGHLGDGCCKDGCFSGTEIIGECGPPNAGGGQGCNDTANVTCDPTPQKCIACGTVGHPCCATSSGSVCDGRIARCGASGCEPCGQPGQRCCHPKLTQQGQYLQCATTTCDSNDRCTGGSSSDAGNPCGALAAPTGLSPGGNLCITIPVSGTGSIPVSWNTVPNAVRYDFQIENYTPIADQAPGRTNCFVQGGLESDEGTISVTGANSSLVPKHPTAAGVGYVVWKVTAVGACGQKSSTTSIPVVTFQVPAIPDGGAMLAPEPGVSAHMTPGQ
jgi:hypothetical protein